MNALIVDANIILSALLGRSLPVVQDAVDRGLMLVVPETQWMEVRAVLNHLRPDLTDELMAQAEEMIDIFPSFAFDAFEDRARERLPASAQKDWPVLASAMTVEAGIWSKDRDFFGVGVPVWTTENVRFVEVLT
jgi:predicted nucleic acid-binding protein